MPKISVIIPAYNAEKYIAQALDSVLSQTFQDFEILCVEDYSTDDTLAIIQQFAKNYDKITLIKNTKHLGPGECRNIALKRTNGEIIACVDADDTVCPDLFEKIMNKFEETNVSSVWIKADIFWENEGTITPMSTFPFLQNQSEGILELTSENLSDYPAYSWNKFYKKNSIKENIFWSKDQLFEDVEFYYRYYTQNPVAYVIDEPLYLYRRHDKSIIGQSISDRDYINDVFYVTQNIYNFLKENNLFEQYKKSLLQLMLNNIRDYENTNAKGQNTITLINETLKYIHFPEEYADLKLD